MLKHDSETRGEHFELLSLSLGRIYFTELTAYPVFFGRGRDGGSEYECNVTKKCPPAIELIT